MRQLWYRQQFSLTPICEMTVTSNTCAVNDDDVAVTQGCILFSWQKQSCYW